MSVDDQQPIAISPVEITLSIIGGKWKPLIIYFLMQDTMRFSELKRSIPTVTQRILTKQLREMEASGIINRKVYAEVPPRVEYSLTQLGRSLQPILDAMLDWGMVYIAQHPHLTLKTPADLRKHNGRTTNRQDSVDLDPIPDDNADF